MTAWHPQTIRHYLTEVDPVVRTATCSACGPTTLLRASNGFRCEGSVRRSRHRYKMLDKYGLHWETWELMLIAQSGRCAICRVPMKAPCVDHCHTTGAVRGLLCSPCNQGLGAFRDDPHLLRVAADYLAN